MHILPKQKPAADGAVQVKKPHRKFHMSKKRVIALVLVLALIVGAAAGAKALFFGGEEQVALTEMTTYGSLATTIEGTGTTLPADSITVTTASTAKIEQVNVAAGDTVQVGDLLYTQDDAELDDQIEEYQDEIATLQDELDSSYQQLSDLSETMAALTVTAPFSGRVTEVAVELGDEVSKGTRLAARVDDTAMTLTQYFSYTYEDQISVGMEAGVSISSLMLNLAGRVTGIEKVDRVTTEGTRCFAVTVTVENPGSLTKGMTGAGYLVTTGGEKLYPAVEGELEYKNSKTLSAEVSGELTAVKPVDYQRVTAGETLFVVDGSDYQSQMDTMSQKITQTQARIVSYQEKITGTEEKRSEYAVTAEISGKVIMVGIKAGEKPRQAGQTAVSIYNLDSMTVTANIDELDIDSIEMGMEVAITQSGAEQDTQYTGTVTAISYEATNTSGVAYFPITITIASEGALSSGVNVAYTVTVGDASEGVLAPVSALKTTSEGTCLFVKADTKPEGAVTLDESVDIPDGFYAVPVEVGVVGSRYVRILSGVAQDTEVFTRYQQSAPTGGSTTSDSGEEETGTPGGEIPDFGSGGGQRPDFAGGGGGMMQPMG